jgi:hypothetical protein
MLQTEGAMTTSVTEADRNRNHLELLSVFTWVMAGMHLMGCLAGGVHIGLAIFLPRFFASLPPSKDPPPPEVLEMLAGFFAVMGVIVILLSTLVAVLTAWSAYSIHQRRNRVWVLVVGAFHLLSMPFGTALGVYTIIVMTRPGVKAWFEGRALRA